MVSCAVEVRNLSYTVDGRQILRDISFSAEKGTFLAVIGPNGAGKSTLLKCAGGLVRYSSGHVLIDGCDMVKMRERERARKIAWMHQSGTDLLTFTVRHFAAMSRYPWQHVLSGGADDNCREVNDALVLAGAADFAERRINTLSGGERQRALLAAALAQGTDILFLDEPASFLDYKQQVEMVSLVENINKSGKTIVMVTHDINHALHSAREILAVKNGSVAWHGYSDDLLKSSALSDIYETEFKFFEKSEGCRQYAVPLGFVK